MDVTPLVKSGTQILQSYAGGRFKVSGQVYEGAVIVMPSGTVSWDVSSFEALSVSDFDVIPDDVDVVLLGGGTQMALLPPDLRAALKDNGLHVDVMDTGAACRTYNVLMAEGRRVAAALFPAG